MMGKPKVLFIELLDDNYGNKRLDLAVIERLNLLTELDVAYPVDWLDSLPDECRKHTYEVNQNIKPKKVREYCHYLQNLWVAKKLDRQHNYDYVFCASYHTYVMALALLLFPGKLDKLFVLHHNNIDLIDQSVFKRFFFRMYCHKVKHMVLEPFIGEHLEKQYGIDPEQIYFLPHPLNEVVHSEEKKYDCVGISNSNDEDWVQSMIAYEQETHAIENAGLRVVLRSKERVFDNGFLTVIKGRLSDAEYYDYATGAKALVLPFPGSFRYRMSGSIVDAFSNDVRVFANRIPVFKAFESQFPAICKTEIEPHALICQLSEQKAGSDEAVAQFARFRELHSKESIDAVLKKMFSC